MPTSTDLRSLIQQGAFLVDVRMPGEYAEGSVPGAVNIPLDSIARRLDEFRGKPSVVVFCRSGNRSGQAQMLLQAHGIPAVHNGGTWMQVAQLTPTV
jgi:phage shock protein E